jgi:hypothetical protein
MLKKMHHPLMNILLPPGTGANCNKFAERKLGQLPCISDGAAIKKALFYKNSEKITAKVRPF